MHSLFAHQIDPTLFAALAHADSHSVTNLEKKVADLLKRRYVVAFNSPAAATLAAYSAAGINHGEIILSPIAPVHEYNAAAALNLSIRYCDIKLDGTLHEKEFGRAITTQSKAVNLFHYAGISCALKPIITTAKEHDLTVFEDATQTLKPKKSSADIVIYSLQSIMPSMMEKTGFVACDDNELAQKLRYFNAGGKIQKAVWNFEILDSGHELYLSPISAAAALHQLKSLDEIIKKRQEITAFYDTCFKANKLLDLIPRQNTLPLHFYPILLSPALHCPKEDIFTALRNSNIEIEVHTKPIYKTKFFAQPKTRLPIAEDFYRSEISLPCHHQLSTDDVRYIADTFLEIVNTYAYRGCSF